METDTKPEMIVTPRVDGILSPAQMLYTLKAQRSIGRGDLGLVCFDCRRRNLDTAIKWRRRNSSVPNLMTD